MGDGESALRLSLYDDSGYRFLILSGEGTDEDAGAILIELNHVEALAAALLALKALADEPPVV